MGWVRNGVNQMRWREGKEMDYRTADTELAQMLHHMIEKLGKITCPRTQDGGQ